MNDTKPTSNGNTAQKYDQFFYGHGKLLLTGEYLILDGARGLALPTCFGQSMGVSYDNSYDPKLHWRSFDEKGNLWLEANFEFWHFNCLDENPSEDVLQLQKILKEARRQNKHFLRDSQSVTVETRLSFNRDWGLGSSSTLLYNIAQWAYISPFELAKNTFGGSGYDIACASSNGPVIYSLVDNDPNWSTVEFFPKFHEKLFFVHLGRKQNTRDSVKTFRAGSLSGEETIETINAITDEIVDCEDFAVFNSLIAQHEEVIAKATGLTPVKKERFSNFDGQVKSLGAWGGDFSLVSTDLSLEEVKSYFKGHGLEVVIPFQELILKGPRFHKDQNLDLVRSNQNQTVH